MSDSSSRSRFRPIPDDQHFGSVEHIVANLREGLIQSKEAIRIAGFLGSREAVQYLLALEEEDPSSKTDIRDPNGLTFWWEELLALVDIKSIDPLIHEFRIRIAVALLHHFSEKPTLELADNLKTLSRETRDMTDAVLLERASYDLLIPYAYQITELQRTHNSTDYHFFQMHLSAYFLFALASAIDIFHVREHSYQLACRCAPQALADSNEEYLQALQRELIPWLLGFSDPVKDRLERNS